MGHLNLRLPISPDLVATVPIFILLQLFIMGGFGRLTPRPYHPSQVGPPAPAPSTGPYRPLKGTCTVALILFPPNLVAKYINMESTISFRGGITPLSSHYLISGLVHAFLYNFVILRTETTKN